ncbi:hypothetical protein [Candidatus Palauibacter sp.]|uniref:hypothetical protein n=1 Tax=Candidatus Palauibacter sp. TaxID=3101350 RepID=UPI003B01DFD6
MADAEVIVADAECGGTDWAVALSRTNNGITYLDVGIFHAGGPDDPDADGAACCPANYNFAANVFSDPNPLPDIPRNHRDGCWFQRP